jgi:hypothetical protein
MGQIIGHCGSCGWWSSWLRLLYYCYENHDSTTIAHTLYIYTYVYVCICIWKWILYMYMYICICICICICVEYIRIYIIYIYNHCYDDIIIIAAVSCGHAKGPIDLLIQNAGYFMESGSQGYRVSWVW